MTYIREDDSISRFLPRSSPVEALGWGRLQELPGVVLWWVLRSVFGPWWNSLVFFKSRCSEGSRKSRSRGKWTLKWAGVELGRGSRVWMLKEVGSQVGGYQGKWKQRQVEVEICGKLKL